MCVCYINGIPCLHYHLLVYNLIKYTDHFTKNTKENAQKYINRIIITKLSNKKFGCQFPLRCNGSYTKFYYHKTTFDIRGKSTRDLNIPKTPVINVVLLCVNVI